jgi:tRNA synthetases class I (I, L, M and V)
MVTNQLATAPNRIKKSQNSSNTFQLQLSPISLDKNISLECLNKLILGDVVHKILNKKGLYAEMKVMFDGLNPDIFNRVKFHLTQQDSQFSEGDNMEIQEQILFQSYVTAVKHENKWLELFQEYNIDIDVNKNTVNTSDRLFTETVWKKLWQIWRSGGISKNYEICYFSPELKTSFKTNDYNISFEKTKENTPVVRFALTSIARKKFVQKILLEIEKQVEEQENLQEEVVNRMMEIKGLGVINKKSRFDILSAHSGIIDKLSKQKNIYEENDNEELNKNDKKGQNSFESNNFASINWDNFKTDVEFDDEIRDLKRNLETINENLNLITYIQELINREGGINLLSLINEPKNILANVALAIHPDLNYSLYYLENTKEFVIVAESRSVQILSLNIDPASLDGSLVARAIDTQQDGGEFFSSIGEKIYKIFSFLGRDLEGIEYNPVFDSEWWNISWSEKTNCHKLYCSSEIDKNAGTGIRLIAPAYNELDFAISSDRSLPLVFLFNRDGSLVPELLQTHKQLQSGTWHKLNNMVCSLLNQDKKIFANLFTSINRPFYQYNTQTTIATQSDLLNNHRSVSKYYLYLTAEQKLCLKHSFIDKRWEDRFNYIPSSYEQVFPVSQPYQNWGVPLPQWKSKNGDQIFVTSLSQIALQCLNPIFILLNHRDLNPRLYESGNILIFTDKITKLPLGINALQYRSSILSEMRKGKIASSERFNLYASKLLDEIYSLFPKYQTIQIILDNQEQSMFSSWLWGLHPSSSRVERIFYFYEPLDTTENKEKEAIFANNNLDTGQDKVNKQMKLLKPNIVNFKQIQLVDDLGVAYQYSPEIIDKSLAIALYQSEEYNNEIEAKRYLFWNSNEYRFWWLLINLFLTHENQFTSLLQYHSTAINNIDITDISKDCLRYMVFNSSVNILTTSEILDDLHHKNSYKSEDRYEGVNDDVSDDTDKQKFTQYSQDEYIKNVYHEDGEYIDKYFLYDKTINKYLQSLNDYIVKYIDKNNHIQPYVNQFNYTSTLNKWIQVYTQEKIIKILQSIDSLDLQEIFNQYSQYLKVLVNTYLHLCQFSDNEYHSENLECLVKQLHDIFSIMWVFQPDSVETLMSYITGQTISQLRSEYSSNYFPSITPLNSYQRAVLDKMNNFLMLREQIQTMRSNLQISLRQPLYADVSNLTLSDFYLDLLYKTCNLVQSDLSDIYGNVEEIETLDGIIKIDVVIYEELSNIGFSRVFEKAVGDFIKDQGWDTNKIINMNWQIGGEYNEEIVEKVLQSINWHKLNIAIHWKSDIDNEDHLSFEINDLATILVQKID